MARIKLSFLLATLAGLVAFSSLAADADGQTSRKRTTSKANAVTTPTPNRGEPAVISRADDYPTVVIEPAPIDGTQLKLDPSTSASGSTDSIEDLRERLLLLESKGKKDPDQVQRRLSLNLDILTKAEQRSDGLRKQLFEMIEKESTIRTRIDQIENDARPEALERSFATVGLAPSGRAPSSKEAFTRHRKTKSPGPYDRSAKKPGPISN